MITGIGPVCDEYGLGRKRWHTEDAHGVWDTRSRSWAMPATQFRRNQAPTINVDVNHDHVPCGQVVHLELSAEHPRRLWAVAHLDDRAAAPPGPLYWSAEANWERADSTDVVLDWLSLTPYPAQLGMRPIQFLRGGMEYRGASKRWPASELDGFRRGMCERAATEYVLRARNTPIRIHEAEREPVVERLAANALLIDGEVYASPTGHLEHPGYKPPPPEPGRPPGRLRRSAPYKGILRVS